MCNQTFYWSCSKSECTCIKTCACLCVMNCLLKLFSGSVFWLLGISTWNLRVSQPDDIWHLVVARNMLTTIQAVREQSRSSLLISTSFEMLNFTCTSQSQWPWWNFYVNSEYNYVMYIKCILWSGGHYTAPDFRSRKRILQGLIYAWEVTMTDSHK